MARTPATVNKRESLEEEKHFAIEGLDRRMRFEEITGATRAGVLLMLDTTLDKGRGVP